LPGNVFLPAAITGLPRDSVVNVTAIVTVDEAGLEGPVGTVGGNLLAEIEDGLRRILGL